MYANKFVLTGYLAGAVVVGSIGGVFYSKSESSKVSLTIIAELAGFYSALSLLGTMNGIGTKNAYNRTKTHLAQYGEVEKIANKYIQSRGNGEFVHYCDKKGVELAAKEFKLEDKVKKCYDGVYTNCIIFRYKNKC
jgi:hypothetical protein